VCFLYKGTKKQTRVLYIYNSTEAYCNTGTVSISILQLQKISILTAGKVTGNAKRVGLQEFERSRRFKSENLSRVL